LPDLAKFVVIIAPHTSNTDFLVGLAPLFALGLRVSFMAKSALFWEPLGTYLRWVGAVPIERSAAGGAVREALKQFEEKDQFILVITPEGTRAKVTRWKSGFHRIALKAGVPIVPLTFDYGRREFRFGAPYTPTDDLAGDVKTLQAFYHAGQAKNPDQF
jgi:1-acyl-sn-glycerol-3-phosphate acyltransferase